ncbi:hypothetical protein B0T17DRAFT_617227 [Bombardia bombarda]|uniref:Oxysterol-binding protein n=1 Tax=Bombardia bombarda TaxID=252184 RepID=A0AA39X0U7_9PEZI|nr:hypothetical protein B0T17DRAFT_617227 [Bombardia bombarda]
MDSRSVSSRLRELVKFLSTVQGDLSNVTGPPSLLAPSSVVEVGHCWAQRPAVFAAPAHESCPAKRALLVLRWFLIALRSQLYVAGAPRVSIKKPLNAFLGELFLASWSETNPTTNTTTKTDLVAEQNGIRADGYARVEMTFNGAVNIRQVGHAMLRIDRFDEHHLVPLPDVKVRGFLAGCMYPEIVDTYTIVSSSGFVTEIKFSGEGILRGKKNTFAASIYRKSDPARRAIYTVSGVWSDGWTATDARTGETLEVYKVDAEENAAAPVDLPPVEEQDPWESRRAWGGVLNGMEAGDMRKVLGEKTRIEQAQRAMRRDEESRGEKWEPLLFQAHSAEDSGVFHELAEGMGAEWGLFPEKTKGVWRVDGERVKGLKRPFRPGMTPLG